MSANHRISFDFTILPPPCICQTVSFLLTGSALPVKKERMSEHFKTRYRPRILVLFCWGLLLLSVSCRSHVPTARSDYSPPPPPPPPREEPTRIVEPSGSEPVQEIPPLEPRLPARVKKPSLLPPPPIASAEDWLIIVKKGKRKLHLYRDCQLFKTFPVDLGENPQGPKLYQGDNRTPEGLYRIVEKKDRGKTRYYLALLLDYPNLRDRSRYDSALKTGKLPNGIGIGGLIEIHGEGRGEDWTQGCIALHNHHMDNLFSSVPLGTPVWIEP
jgi:hypothetical protein